MKNTVYFANSGLFDVRAMLTFGVSAKEQDNAIGFFGTGFKYAVAIILRNGGTISIKTKGAEYQFFRRQETIRGQQFDLVYMRDGTGKESEAGFTTRLGINWQPWQAFRELYSNCIDEDGTTGTDEPTADTVIAVNCEPIYQAWINRRDYFLDSKPIDLISTMEIHPGPANFFYLRGIAVANMPVPGMFRYNALSGVDLTEDRTAKSPYQLHYKVQQVVQQSKHKQVLAAIGASREFYEGTIQFDPAYKTSDEFIQETDRLLKIGKLHSDSARHLLAKKTERSADFPERELSAVETKMLDKAKRFLAMMDVNVGEFPIKCVRGMGDGIMGRALDGKIFLSEIPFQMGTKQVASTLMEEWVHLRHDCADFDRTMQTWLFDKILSLGENINGEPI